MTIGNALCCSWLSDQILEYQTFVYGLWQNPKIRRMFSTFTLLLKTYKVNHTSPAKSPSNCYMTFREFNEEKLQVKEPWIENYAEGNTNVLKIFAD